MGFLDRFSSKSSPAPDAFQKELIARLRARPDVEAVEVADGDTLAVSWRDGPAQDPIAVGALRGPWKTASGFDRIELLDDFLAGLAPGAPPADAPSDGAPAPAPDTAPSPTARPGGDWMVVGPGLLPALRRARSADDGAVSWPVGELLEAVITTSAGATAVTEADCDRWDVSPVDVRAVALDNLGAVDPDPDAVAPDTRAWVATNPAGRQSAWLAAPARLLERCGLTSAIALVPLEGEMVVVDPTDPDLVRSILTSTIQIVEHETDILCPVPFLITDDEVTPWEPAPDDPAAELVTRTRAAWDR